MSNIFLNNVSLFFKKYLKNILTNIDKNIQLCYNRYRSQMRYEIGGTVKFDYDLKTSEERAAHIQKELDKLPRDQELNNRYLSMISDYILCIADKNQTKKEKKEEHPITTKNREVTINKRQVSFEEIVTHLENGEDGIYNLIINDKNQFLDPKDSISEKDIAEIPGIKELLDIIDNLWKQEAKATGKRRFSLRKQIIETYQQIYLLKASARNAPAKGKLPSQFQGFIQRSIPENIYLDENDMPKSDAALSLLNPSHVSFLLCYYSQLKQEAQEHINSDMHALLLDLENIVDDALREYPVYYDLLIWKIDGLKNNEIQELMRKIHGEEHTEQYYSSVWRKRIPNLIVEEAQRQYLIWYYTNKVYGKWKKCSKCGEIKPAHNLFFSKNSSSSGWYSQCKHCRNTKGKESPKKPYNLNEEK